MHTISLVIVLNGIYDIICSISILRVLPIPFFGTIHQSMFTDETAVDEHILAYWILSHFKCPKVYT